MRTLALFGLVLAGCGGSYGIVSTSPATGCSASRAAVGIYEGMLQNLCGCTGVGENGTIVAPGSLLTCTVPVGTTVVFQYLGTIGPHQIVAVGTPSFDPGAPNVPVSVTFSTAASTYNYRDVFNAALQGQIVVP